MIVPFLQGKVADHAEVSPDSNPSTKSGGKGSSIADGYCGPNRISGSASVYCGSLRSPPSLEPSNTGE